MPDAPEPSEPFHLDHCFDYLRQAVMCSGDTALEKAMVVDGERRREVLGWGVEHECRDYEAIFKFARERRSRDSFGIKGPGHQ
ncbi:hypothetical protein EJ06DRAFT_478226 [Trichodelitschia bisporula]|uniref:Uncharacterized protein n=1 Tax=Trichodelitschia bisporula TaxID=703511 RepID=A0A6G1HTH2_9PEZI|nr:hypothetical protein EJ06DRAFT_478226 [Trichodelitschia bisporula]